MSMYNHNFLSAGATEIQYPAGMLGPGAPAYTIYVSVQWAPGQTGSQAQWSVNFGGGPTAQATHQGGPTQLSAPGIGAWTTVTANFTMISPVLATIDIVWS